MQARQATIKVKYENKDISQHIERFLKSFSCEEAVSNEADTAQITLQDIEELWIGDFFPEKGARIEVSIETINWYRNGVESVNLGVFELDEIENTFPGAECKLKLNSIPTNAEIRGVNHSRSWEKVQLSKIAKDVADGAGMELFYDTKEDPIITRAEQSEQSDLKFLSKLCTDAGLALKVTDNKICIFDFEKYESQPAKEIFIKGESRIKSFSAKSRLSQIYKSCTVTYKKGKTKETIEGSYSDTNKKDGATLKINKKVESKEEAEKLAKKSLREKNKKENTVTLTLMGDLRLSAGLTVELEKFHKWNGKYLIEKVKHEIGSSGFVTTLELSKCLEGY